MNFAVLEKKNLILHIIVGEILHLCAVMRTAVHNYKLSFYDVW